MQSPKTKIRIDAATQILTLESPGHPPVSFPVSLSPRGLGTDADSHQTPPGHFVVIEKIGAGLPPDTVFQGRVPRRHLPARQTGDDLVMTRILRLHGIDPHNANTLERFIYIHGTNHPDLVGRPAGHGCVRMRPSDILALYPLVPVGTPVAIVADSGESQIPTPDPAAP